MPMHDWTRVEAGIFHAFHHRWISAISDLLNTGILPEDYYALPEQVAAGFGPDVLTLQDEASAGDETREGGVAVQSRPQTRFTAESDGEFYRRKKSSVAVRHVSGDRIVAIVEIISPGNKSTRYAFAALVEKACEFLEHRIHLLIVDPLPPGPRDPQGVHAAIWEHVQEDSFQLPADKPLTLVAYECDRTTRAYIEPLAVGDALPEMPLFLAPGRYVEVPLEASYETAYAVLPRRWRRVLDAGTKGREAI
ncbi:MAG: DUF4058 family protein [Planctomycetes bacterium]|nr:DUF4058 family protein [Planctomycetota bacterium]